MKKLFLKLVVMLVATQNLIGQFHSFYKASTGFAISPSAAIINMVHYGSSGGGVLLKGVARPKNQDSAVVFTNITFVESNGISTMYIQTPDSKISFSDSTWTMRDAAMLVKSETQEEMYRDVNLHGSFSDDEYRRGLDQKFPTNKYYNVEMTDSLIRTRSGNVLLLIDLMITNNRNTSYYSNDKEACEKFFAAKKSLFDSVSRYNDSVNELKYIPAKNAYLKLIKFDSLKHSGKLDSNEIFYLDKLTRYSIDYLFKNKLYGHFTCHYDSVGEKIVDSLFDFDHYSTSINMMNFWNDYTYNDEGTDYVFFFTNDKRLSILGEPHYTFLYNNGFDEPEVNAVYTNYFLAHPDLIRNLNIRVMDIAERFGKIASFDRYLKINYPKLWSQVYAHYLHIKKSTGETPRFVRSVESDDQE